MKQVWRRCLSYPLGEQAIPSDCREVYQAVGHPGQLTLGPLVVLAIAKPCLNHANCLYVT